jgi:ATP-binding cassette subfamily F protein 3
MRGFDKLAIVGPNGTGKTTLLKVIEKKLLPIRGRIEFLRNYKIGYFDQNQTTLNLTKTIFEEIHDYYPMFTIKDVRSVAARFLFFNEDLDKPISILSGGEKVRLVLLLLMLEKPDLLILDEPTNHLDIETKDIIEDVFNEFSGPIIFVSHDRYFINKIGTKLIHLSEDGMIEFEGSYDAFKEYEELNKQQNVEKSKRREKPKKNVQKVISKLEQEIHSLETKLSKLKQETMKDENATDYNVLTTLSNDIDELETIIHEKEINYLELLEEQEGKEV